MSDYWFKPKTHGWGATPSNWKGWAATLVYSAFMVAFSVYMVRVPAGGKVDLATALVWLVMVIAITTAFMLFTKSKTDGEWKWRWGEKK